MVSIAELIFWVKDVCTITAALLCLSSVAGLGSVQTFHGVKESGVQPAIFEEMLVIRRSCGLPGLNWQVSIAGKMFAISDHAFDGSTTIEQEQYVCTNTKCSESPEKLETLLGPGAHSFNALLSMWIPKYLYGPTFDGLITDNHRRASARKLIWDQTSFL